MKLNGSEIVVECLKEQDVDTVFGYPGGAILNLYDALYKEREHVRHVLVSHEQGAAHAADGYARASGKVGVCLATSGPGATNLVTGIATAYMDSSPMVVITCNVGLSLLGRDSFQEVDIAGVTMPVTKHNFIVKNIEDLASTLRRAFVIAGSGRPGPVLVDIPKNITAETCEFKKEKLKPLRVAAKCPDEVIKNTADMINRAKKPFIFVGGGAITSNAVKQIAKLAKLVDAPVCDSLMGKGAFDGNDKRYTGMLGMHGTVASNLGVSECDLLIALGTRFSDRVIGAPEKFAKHCKVIQFDIDIVEINKNVTVDAYVRGDLKESLDRILPLIQQADHKEWMEHIEKLKKDNPLKLDDKSFNGPQVIDAVYRITKGEAVIVTEVGQHQMWAAQYYKYKRPRQLITSGGLGTMGFGLGAANGAKCVAPESTVINIAGDGCFRMNMNELLTSKREGFNIIEIVMNNQTLGMVRQWQELFYDSRYSATVFRDDVDYAAIAKAMGVASYKASSLKEFENCFKEALKENRPAVIEVLIETNKNVWPMVAPGAAISKVMTEDMKKGESN